MEMKNFDKKKMYVVVILIISIILLISISDLFPRKVEKSHPNGNLVKENVQSDLSKECLLEQRLEKILSNIKGVKSVKVMITLQTNGQIEPAFNKVKSTETSEENDSSGGKRTVVTQNTTESLVTQNSKDGNEPILIKSIEPEIKGVIVVADGAEDVLVKEKLFEAVKTVLQIAGHKIEVYPKN